MAGARDLNPSRLGLALALVAAALLRFWALPQGVPFSARRRRAGGHGARRPHDEDGRPQPALLRLPQASTCTSRRWWPCSASSSARCSGEVDRRWRRRRPKSSTSGAARVTAMLGTATVWVVYRAAMRWSARTALLAAVLIAVMPLHVRESHYVLTDVAGDLLRHADVAAVAARARAIDGAGASLWPARRRDWPARLKYNGVLAVMMPLIACAMTPRRPSVAAERRCRWIVAGDGRDVPRSRRPTRLLDLPTFLNQFARLSSEYRAPPTTAEPMWLDLSQAPAQSRCTRRAVVHGHRRPRRWPAGAS